MKEKIYDVAIIGGGPAGITAAVYAKRTGLDVVLIEKEKEFGGQVLLTYEVANYTGFGKVSGPELAKKMHQNLLDNDIYCVHDEVSDTVLDGDVKQIICHKTTLKAYTVIIAVGTAVRRLEVTNERQFLNNGISYSSARDRDKYLNKTVAVVGGGNTALEDALFLSQKAKKVYIIHRRDRFRGDDILVDEVLKNKKITPVWESKVVDLVGKTQLQSVTLKNVVSEKTKVLKIDGLFVCIGRGAETDFIDEKVVRNENGYLVADDNMQTNLDGVFVAGDIRNTPLRQIVCATSDGAIAATSAFRYLGTKRGTSYV